MIQTLLLFIAYSGGLTGSVILWRFGLPYKDINRNGYSAIVLEQEDENKKKEWKVYNRLSHIGILLIAASFLLQIIALGVS